MAARSGNWPKDGPPFGRMVVGFLTRPAQIGASPTNERRRIVPELRIHGLFVIFEVKHLKRLITVANQRGQKKFRRT
jgi:hypothetical protein